MSTALPAIMDAHLPVLPVLLPAATAVLLLLGDPLGHASGSHGHRRLLWARRIALASTSIGLLLAVALALQADAGGTVPRVYRIGDWPAPFGIVLVVDRLAALMLLLTSLVALPVLLYAGGGWDSRGRHFHPLLQFQLMGLNGAFVTGDLFNLFVSFEVLLIASYALMLHGLGRERLRAGLHYVVLNLVASSLFLVGVSLLYATTGTLNLADLALRVPQAADADATLLRAAALLLLGVFGFKAALMPLSIWLPATYAAAGAPVAALFAIMTKVGVYAIVRVHGVVFGAGGGAAALAVEPLLLPAALATSLFAVLGALASGTLPRLLSWLTVVSVGTIVAALGLYSAAAWSAAFFYLANSTLVIAALFLLSELVAAQRGDAGARLEPGSAVAQPALLGLLMLLSTASVAGVPPLPGFVGKLMILEAALPHGHAAAVWTVVLGVGFLTLIGLARAGSMLFWNVRADAGGASGGASLRLVGATVWLIALTVAMSVFAAPLQRYADAAARQLLDRDAYANAVLGGTDARTSRPYRGRMEAPR